ncbi:MAG TPA: PQQ-dependent sugar dehydrogenase [Candidatus Limnocylindrales bacterium]|nr:PQQ-dependent sugar dehydrogenase [Candidatus Limnocylindrales bacterium]
MRIRLAAVAALAGALSVAPLAPVAAQDGPHVVDANLQVDTAVSGLALPTSIAFLGADDLLVLEKDTGRVLHVVDGTVAGTAIDLAVNNFSERGLLGIALHPDFPADTGVYLFWTCRTEAPPADPFIPDEETCSDANMLGADTNDVLRVPLLANRIDRFTWDGPTSTLTFDHRLITIRQFQNDASPEPPGQGDDATGPHGAQPVRGNHDGGIIAFGPDGKLYAYVGDAGRRGALANLPCGPTATECNGPEDVTPDDQFGGPEADDAHFTGVILRLNDDGSTPSDNPFFAAGAAIGGEVGANIQKVFAYGMRNSFGMAFDPIGGGLWEQENGEDAFDEVNLVEPGMNNGWIQIQGPLDRLADYRLIETTSLHNEDFPNLQQFRWGPEQIATSQAEALSRLYEIPGSHYNDPEFSWKHVIAPAAIGFVGGSGLGRQYRGDLLVGMSVPIPDDGVLLRFNLTGNRTKIGVDDPRLEDRVADNIAPNDLTESESLLFGTGFGIVTDIETAPDGSVWVVSLSSGAIYRISRS